jgi:BirA family biotin operon repressor/biotin-[acetyl-CoA-carboxylase] ligase
LGKPFIELTVVESTNIYAMERLQANLAAHGTAFFAHHQTAGKGQHGKSWSGEPGNNIALSVIIDCSFLSIARQFPLSVMVAVACHDLFNKYTTDQASSKGPMICIGVTERQGGSLSKTK